MNTYGCDDGVKAAISTSFDQSPQESASKKELNFQKNNQEQELGRISEGPSSQENRQVVFNLENDEVEITA